MHANVNAQLLADAIKQAVSPLKSDKNLLTFAHLSAHDSELKIETTDSKVYSQISLPVDVKESGTCLMRTAALKAAIGSCGLVQIKGNGSIVRGNSRYKIETLADYEAFPHVEVRNWKPLNHAPSDFLNALMQVYSASDEDDCREVCQAINVNNGYLWATDGKRLSRAATGVDGPEFSLPSTFIPLLKGRIQHMTQLSLGYYSDHVPPSFFRATGPSNTLVTHLLRSSFSNIEIDQWIPAPDEASARLRVDCKAMCNVLMRSRVLATDLKGICVLVLRLQAGKIALGNREKCYAECLVENGAVLDHQGEASVAFSCQLMLQIFRSMTTNQADVYLFSDASKPLLILPADKTPEQVAHILMPCAL